MWGVEELSGVELLGLLLFGVVVDDGLVALFGFEVLESGVLEGEVELGELEVLLLDGEAEFVSVLLLELDGEVEFMSVLLLELDGDVVEDGELEVLDPVWLDEVDGVL